MKPDHIEVFQNIDSYPEFVCTINDSEFEGQCFDRKQAGDMRANNSFQKRDLNELVDQVEKTVSAFANTTGGLLVVGVSKTGELLGTDHLTEEHRSALLSLSGLQNPACTTKLHTLEHNGHSAEIALFLVQPTDRTFCFRTKDDAAWLRKGPSSIRLKGLELEQIKRERRFVDFASGVADDFDEADVDIGVLTEFAVSQDYTIEEDSKQVLRNAGALNGKLGA